MNGKEGPINLFAPYIYIYKLIFFLLPSFFFFNVGRERGYGIDPLYTHSQRAHADSLIHKLLVEDQAAEEEKTSERTC